jgi:two-component system sensor histidine kinase TctE
LNWSSGERLDVQYDAIEVVVYRLRKKLAHTGATLVTLRGLGYLLKASRDRVTIAAPATTTHLRRTKRAPCHCGATCCWASCCPVTLLVVNGAFSLYRQALKSAERGLRPHFAGLGQIHRGTAEREAGDGTRHASPDCPTAALEAFEADNRSRLYYRVQRLQAARWCRASTTCRRRARPLACATPTPRWSTSMTSGSASEPVRVAVLLQPVVSPNRPRHGRDPGGRDAGAAPGAGAPPVAGHAVAQAMLVAVIALVAVFVVQRATRAGAPPQRALRQRPETDLTPSAPDAPRELLPLVDATNR